MILPSGMLKDGAFLEKRLDAIIEKQDAVGMRDGMLWVDIAFKVPSGQTPVAFQFKQNAMVSLIGIPPVPTTPEIEQQLNADEKDDTPPTP